jgi:hypothetical protein
MNGGFNLALTEEERQAVLMALAHLAVERPGWDPALLAPIALRIDNNRRGRPALYDEFRQGRLLVLALASELASTSACGALPADPDPRPEPLDPDAAGGKGGA